MNESETTQPPKAIAPANESRRALPRWAQIVVLLVVFAAGGVVGAMVATKCIHSRMEYLREHADALPNDIVPRLQMRLGLSDAQTAQVREIVERRHPRMIAHRTQGAQAIHMEFDAMVNEIGAVLDGDQKRMWHAMADSVRHRFLPPAPGK